jgi:(S)-ureidoglycine aminohydrolase
LITPDAFVRTTLPGMKRAAAVVHVGPALGAAFTEYTVEFEPGGELGGTGAQRFIYVLDGSLDLELDRATRTLAPRGYAYLPQRTAHGIHSREKARALVIEKPYVPVSAAELPKSPDLPRSIVGNEDAVPAAPLMDDASLEVKLLLPDEPAFDFAVNIMVYQPGASLSIVEMHIMEHGLMMLEGGGIYRLGDAWYSVTAGDFIWMGPWCPQWFGAIGRVPAKYIIYKDANRHPLAGVQE